MMIDCDSCTGRGLYCEDCVVTAILGKHEQVAMSDDELCALAVLADSGLVPPLRLLPAGDVDPGGTGHTGRGDRTELPDRDTG